MVYVYSHKALSWATKNSLATWVYFSEMTLKGKDMENIYTPPTLPRTSIFVPRTAKARNRGRK